MGNKCLHPVEPTEENTKYLTDLTHNVIYWISRIIVALNMLNRLFSLNVTFYCIAYHLNVFFLHFSLNILKVFIAFK